MYYLVDAGSSSIKVYQYVGKEVKLLEKKSYVLHRLYSKEKKQDFVKEDMMVLFSVFDDLKTRYQLSKSNTKIYGTGYFRNIKNRMRFVKSFYEHVHLYFNIIDQDLETFYLERKLSSFSTQIGRTLIINIGGGSLELVMCKDGVVIDTKKIPFGVNSILKKEFPEINSTNDSEFLSRVVASLEGRLPAHEDKFENVIYTGGELTFMQRIGYPLKANELFEDANHPCMIGISDYIKFNKSLFDHFRVDDLLMKMPENPIWMMGARACSAIAQAICLHYGVKWIVPSDFNMIDGVVAQEARTAVICGSFNKHLDKIEMLISILNKQGIKVLSPRNTTIMDVKNGFILLEGDRMKHNCTWPIESRHLEAIKKSDMVIACNYDGYIGFSTAFEIGYAYSHGKKVVFLENNDIASQFDSPSEIGLLCLE